MRALLFALLSLSAVSLGPGKVEWTADIEEALVRAEKEGRVIVLALGVVAEGRTEAHVKEVYSDKDLSDYFAESVNVAAWSFGVDEEKQLPRFSGLKPSDHLNNLAVITERWMKPNSGGVIALPQHVWLSPTGEVLLSCIWEIDAEEFGWCFDEAMRRVGIEERPKPVKGAHPPRRLLLGEVYRWADEEALGRGLKPDELEVWLDSEKRGREEEGEDGVPAILRGFCTDEADVAEHFIRQIGVWELFVVPSRVDGAFWYIGNWSSVLYLDLLERFSGHNRPSARAQIAVAYEQIGHSDGLAVVKKALKREKDDGVRAEWVRALGACGRGDKSTSKVLVRLAQKEKNNRVRRNAILALGHVLPEKSALEELMELAVEGEGDDRWAAVLGLALGRATEARELIAGMKEGEDDEDLLKIIERSLRVLDGGNLYEIQSSFSVISESELYRGRLFFRPNAPDPEDEREE